MIIRDAKFVRSATGPDQYPPAGLPEVAFAGRSNVGKSSLLNTLLNRRKLVRTSKTPGCTRALNFFEVNGRFRFVDLPGYGYARVPVPVRAAWRPMVETYLHERRDLRAVVFLLDSRRVPSADDLLLWDWLREQGKQSIVVLTKVDKLSRHKRQQQAASIAARLSLEPGELIQFSAVTREGRDRLWEAIAGALGASMERDREAAID